MAVFGKDLGQNVQASGFIGANHECATGGLTVVSDGHQRFVPQTLQAQSIFVEDLTGRSELDGFARPIQQAVPVLLLELADLRADR